MWSALFVLGVLVEMAGCASSQGLSLDALQDEISREESRFFDAQATAVAPARPNAPKLGLYLKPTGFLNREFEWTSRDRDAVLAWSQRVPLGKGRSTGAGSVAVAEAGPRPDAAGGMFLEPVQLKIRPPKSRQRKGVDLNFIIVNTF